MLPTALQKLIRAFSKLPGIGEKSAQRLAYFLLRSHRSLSHELGEALLHLREEITLCQECYMIADSTLCRICKNSQREKNIICVVEHIFDVEAIERSREYHGLYHVLHGRIAPLDEMHSENLKIKELLERIKRYRKDNNELLEIILATNSSSEGETTALYLQKILKPMGVKLTRIATGIPVGADLEYADEVTLAMAMKGRQNYEG